MKLTLGFLMIIAAHYVLGVVYNSSIFAESNFPYVPVYTVLICISIPNGVFAVRSENKNTLIKWVVFSAIPGLLFMTYAKIQGNSRGIMPLTWDWGLWELFLPFIFAVVQLTILIYFIATRKSKGRRIMNRSEGDIGNTKS
ncbi:MULTISPECIES: hypothetical protein [unclassified Cohnella]|uniref:hypothetical protein n=1 Tax=unclassified Cohnella TaxID=2636738 RepID=UPI001180313C|nr:MULTISPECIES: hypothetical protein [unclassified Cohnella]